MLVSLTATSLINFRLTLWSCRVESPKILANKLTSSEICFAFKAWTDDKTSSDLEFVNYQLLCVGYPLDRR